jgi:hypothetical protein
MTGILIVPADRGKPIVDEHFKNTVERTVELKRYAGDIEPDAYTLLKAHSSDGMIRVWGTEATNSSQFRKVHPGMGAYFSGNKKIYTGGLVIATWWSEAMARKLWPGPSANEPTWECMFALGNLQEFDHPTMPICRNWLKYKKDFFQNFVVLDSKFAPDFRKHLPLAP